MGQWGIHVQDKMSEEWGDFITLLRIPRNLKLMNFYFWNVSFNIFGPWLAVGN